MATKAPQEMTVEEALEAYGFKLDGNAWTKPGVDTQIWEPVKGGFRRLERPTAGVVVGAPPFGRPARDGLIEVPYRQTEKYAGVSGLHPATHEEAFEWVWPTTVVHEQYAYAYTGEGGYGRRWARGENGELVPDKSKPDA